MVENNIVVRKAELKDAETIANSNMKMAEETEGRRIDKDVALEGVEAVIRDPHKGFYLVAEKGGIPKRIVGQLLITFEWSDWRNKYFWWIQSVYVDERYRSKKIFSRLYGRVVEMAKYRKDVSGLRLYVEKYNEAAKKAYEALGIERTSYEMYEVEFWSDYGHESRACS